MPYTRPGSAEIKPLIARLAAEHAAVLLANHGPVVSADLRCGGVRGRRVEETAKLVLLTRHLNVRRLSDKIVSELEARFRVK